MKEEKNAGDLIFSVTGKVITKLSETMGTSSGKASLATLRNAIGRPLSQTLEIWPIVFPYIPDEFLSRTGKTTREERVIMTTLQLYALHQQGKSESVSMIKTEDKWNNIGFSLSALRAGENAASADRRFNAMVTSSSFEELSHHLRQMITLLKAKTSEKINYPKLAKDLYWYERGYEENVRLSWARAYYGTKPKGEENHEEK